MQVVEVIARIDRTVVACTYVPADASYFIGDAPGTDLAVPLTGCFPLVQRGRVHLPLGIPATSDRGDTWQLAIALVAITVRKVAPTRVTVARPRLEVRPIAYFLLVLAVELAILLIAFATEPLERLRPPARLAVHVAHVEQLQPPPPPPERAPVTPASKKRAARHAHREAVPEPSWSAGDVAARLDPGNLEAGFDANASGYVPPAEEFGGVAHAFDKDIDENMKTVEVTSWGLPTFIHLGQLAPVPDIEMCDDGSCSAAGPIAIDDVLARLADHRGEIATCYREHTGDLVGTARLRFELMPDGSVHDLRNYGTGTVARCIGKIVKRIAWPHEAAMTTVFVGARFRPDPSAKDE